MQPGETTTVVVYDYAPAWWQLLLLIVVAVAVYDMACWVWDRVLDWWDGHRSDEVEAAASFPPEPIGEPVGEPVGFTPKRPGELLQAGIVRKWSREEVSR